LAAGGDGHTIRLWDVATGQELASLVGHLGSVQALAFTADGKALLSGSNDTSVLGWDLASRFATARPQPRHLQPNELQAFWTDLASDDAGKAYQATWAFVDAPAQAVPFLREHLPPAASVAPKVVAQLIVDLDSERFPVREKAAQELERLGDAAAPPMRRVLAGQPTLELRRRVEHLLAQVDGPVVTPERVRSLRGVEVLEQIGTADAKQVLETLSKGASQARLTQEATATLQRLAKRSAPTP
jgi:hypothetical protein